MIGWWSITRMSWTLLLLTWTLYFLQIGEILCTFLTGALTVAEASLSTMGPVMDTPDPVSVILVASWNAAVSSGRLCMERVYLSLQATTNAFITGTRELASLYSLNLKSLRWTCTKLGKSYATAHSPLSTRTISERYSDL